MVFAMAFFHGKMELALYVSIFCLGVPGGLIWIYATCPSSKEPVGPFFVLQSKNWKVTEQIVCPSRWRRAVTFFRTEALHRRNAVSCAHFTFCLKSLCWQFSSFSVVASLQHKFISFRLFRGPASSSCSLASSQSKGAGRTGNGMQWNPEQDGWGKISIPSDGAAALQLTFSHNCPHSCRMWERVKDLKDRSNWTVQCDICKPHCAAWSDI